MKSDKQALYNKSKGSNGKKNIGPGQFDMLETLEPRLLLTTVGIGGTFEFEDSRGVATNRVIVSLEDDTPGSTAEVVLLNAGAADIVDGDDINTITVNNATAGTILKILSQENAGEDPLALGDGGQAVYDYGSDGVPGGSDDAADTLCPVGTGGVRITGFISADGPMGQIIINGVVLGDVGLNGSIGMFYCGYLEGDVTVAGDLDRMRVALSVGEGVPGDPENITGGDIDVTGGVKSIEIGGDMYKNTTTTGVVENINVAGNMYGDLEIATAPDPDQANMVQVYEEKEIVDPTAEGAGTSAGGNDTPGSGESVFSFSGNTAINGLIEGRFKVDTTWYEDFVDCYTLSLEAGKQVRIAQESRPMGIAVGDLDGFGTANVVTANSTDHTVSVNLWGAGFLPTNYNVGINPMYVVLADFDGVGGLDIAVTNNGSDTITILLNDGMGGFDATPMHFDVGDDPTGIVAGYFDGDGNVDLAVVNAGSNNVSVLLGVGDGTFGAATDFNVGAAPKMLVAGFWDGDANLDLAVTNSEDDSVTVLFGDGAGAFGGAVDYNVGVTPYGIATGNLDGDANADLVVSNLGDDTITVLFGQGAGVFGGAVDYAAGTDPMGILVDDFNLDGNADVAVVNNGDDTVGIYLGTGDGLGTLAAMVAYEVGDEPVGIAAGDFDGWADANELVITNNADDTYSQITSWSNDGIFDPDDTEVADVGGAGENIIFALVRPDGTWVGYGGRDGDIVWTPDVNGDYTLAVINHLAARSFSLAGSRYGYSGTYQIDVYGASKVALGGMHAGGNIGGEPGAPTFTVKTGNAGVISAGGDIVATSIDVQSGGLSELTGANFTDGVGVTVRDSIGLVSGTNFEYGNIYAGQDIEEIRFTGNFSDQAFNTIISAGRHVGQIIIGGNMVAVDVIANDDGVGDPGYVDLVNVGGDLGSLGAGTVTFETGLGGDVRFIRVGGTVYAVVGGVPTNRLPVEVDTSSPADELRIVDDGGGVLTLNLSPGATASYITLPIEGAVGVAIVNLTVNGDANLNINGDVQFGQLDFTPAGGSDSLLMSGLAGRFDVYLLVQTGTADRIVNSTDGVIVSADLGTANVFRVMGNIGDSSFSSGVSSFIHGPLTITTAPGGGALDGIQSSGDLGVVRVNGSVRDIVCGGRLGELIVNADGYTPVGEFHGIRGFVYGNEIGTINVGDGVLESLYSQVAEVGIYSPGTIGEIIVHGANTVVKSSIITETEITRITVSGGASIVGLIEGGDLGDYINGTVNGPKSFNMTTGRNIGTITLSGANTNITDAWLIASGIGEISASGGTDGMVNTEVWAGSGGIGKVLMDGPGIVGSRIRSSAGISAVKATSATGVIDGSWIYAVVNIGHVSAYDIVDSAIDAENTVKKITVKNDFTNTKFLCGGFGTMTVAGDVIMTNPGIPWLEAAGPVNSIRITGQAQGTVHSTGAFANIKEIVTGQMDMTIVSEGEVGKISTTAGNDMDLDLTISGENASLTKLKSGGYLHGHLIIGGPAGQIIAYGELATAGQLIYVDGDVDEISTRMPTGGGAVDIAANIIVNGKLKLLDSAAGITGSVRASEGIGRIYADGDVTGEIVSSHFINYIKVYGGDLISNVTAMFDIKSVYTEAIGGVGGNITGDITSTAGSVLTVHAKGGNVVGNILAERNVGTVKATSGGDVIGNTQALLGKVGTVKSIGGDITGNIQAFADVEKVETTDGQISGNITSDTGNIQTVYASGGDVGGTLTAAVDIFSVRSVTSATGATGDISGNLIAGRNIKEVYNRGGDLTGTVVAGRNINKVNIRGSGDVTGNIQAGGKIKAFVADTVTGATVAAGTDINRIRVYGDVDSSYFLAGYDTGADLAVGGGDDVLTGGNVGSDKAEFRGNFISSVLAAGVGPGVDGLFGTGDDVLAGGESRITRAIITGTAVDTAGTSYGIFADTSIGIVKEGGIVLPDGYVAGNFKVHSIDGADVVPVGTFFLDADNPVIITDNADGDTVTITLTGPGSGTVTTDTGNLIAGNIDVIQLTDVTSTASKLKITVKTPGGANGDFSANFIEMGDDDGLNRLLMPYVDLNGLAGVGVNMDGNLAKMRVADVADGAALNIGGNLNVLSAGDVGNTNITVGGVAGSLTMDSYAGGVLTARNLTAMTVESGNLGADVDVTGGSGKTEINVTGGDVTGNVTTRYNLAKLRVASAGGAGGEIVGNVTSTSGSLTKVVAVGGDLTGNVDAAISIGTVRVRASGGVGGTMAGNVTAGTGIAAVKISGGDLTGNVTAGGGIDLLSIARGDIDGATVLAKGRIKELLITNGGMTDAVVASRLKVKSASMVNMTNSLLSTGTNLDLFKTSGNVNDSDVLSGYWIGDDGVFNSGDDVLGSGTITKAVVKGDIMGSSFAAGVGTGADGYFGTDDDTALEGVSSITKLRVKGAAGDAGVPGVYDGIVAATSLGEITYSGVELGTTGNLTVATRQNDAGGPRVVRMQHSNDKVIITLSEAVLPETLNDLTFLLSGSGSGALAANSITFNPATLEATFDYGASFPLGETITVSLLGDGVNTVQDRGGVSLDGNYTGTMPSGDGLAGGDFVTTFSTF